MKETEQAACTPHDHVEAGRSHLLVSENSVERCARIFRAMGDPPRLRLLARLAQGAFCVGELATVEKETIATISQRLRVLRSENIVLRKRDGKHVLYSLADQHMFDLVANGLAHASEQPLQSTSTPDNASAPAKS